MVSRRISAGVIKEKKFRWWLEGELLKVVIVGRVSSSGYGKES